MKGFIDVLNGKKQKHVELKDTNKRASIQFGATTNWL